MTKNYEPTESEKQKDKENGRREYQSNMTKTYRNKNRGLDIKLESMEILRKRLIELDEELDSQQSELSQSERLEIVAVMAQLGIAIIPD
ncbi:MAG: hypothetical protein PUG66_08080 [Clostridiales bacterium]|nr:hypothetical protein [Clostridiales bacterium]